MNKNDKKDTVVYKFYDKNNTLLYIGITNNLIKRAYLHRKDKDWFKDIESIYISDKMTRNKAHIYEIYHVSKENPLYNVDFVNGGNVDFLLESINFKKTIVNITAKVEKTEIDLKQKTKEIENYLEEMFSKKIIMSMKSDRQELIEMIGLVDKHHSNFKNNVIKYIQNIDTLNTHIKNELNLNYEIKEFETSKVINGEKKRYKSAWKIMKLMNKKIKKG